MGFSKRLVTVSSRSSFEYQLMTLSLCAGVCRLGILILGGMTVGLVKRTTETDLEKLWVEHSSRVVEERLFFNERFVT